MTEKFGVWIQRVRVKRKRDISGRCGLIKRICGGREEEEEGEREEEEGEALQRQKKQPKANGWRLYKQ